MPEVSVIMGTHNSREFLTEALRSVMMQTEVDWELVVVDNGSRDDSAEIVRQTCPPERLQLVVFNEALGPGGALRQAARLARSPLLAVLDADDVMCPGRLAMQRDYLTTRAEVGLVAGRSQIIDAAGVAGDVEPAPNLHEEIFAWTAYTHTLRHSTFVYRKAVAEKVLHRNEFANASDHDFLARVVELTRVACLPDVVLGYRVHDGCTSKTRLAESAAHIALVQMVTRRRRSGQAEDLARWGQVFLGLPAAEGRNAARVHAACARVFGRERCDDLAAFHAWQSWRAAANPAALWLYLRAVVRGAGPGGTTKGGLVRAWLKEPAHALLRRGGVPDRLQF